METEIESQGQPVGHSISMASRLIGRSNIGTSSARSELLGALVLATELAPSLLFDITAPSSFPGDNNQCHAASRDALYHVTVEVPWNWNATTADKLASYAKVNTFIYHLMEITPVASYQVSTNLVQVFPGSTEGNITERSRRP